MPGKGNSVTDALSRKRHDVEIGIQVNALDDDETEFSPSFLTLIREETPKDSSLAEDYEAVTTREMLTRRQRTILNRYHLRDGIIWYEGNRIVVPTSLRKDIFHDHHDSVIAGHPSNIYTQALISRWFYWPKMDKDIAEYC